MLHEKEETGTESAGGFCRNNRRVQVWALLVAGVVVLLGLGGLLTDQGLFPDSTGHMGSGVLLMIFAAALFCEYMDSSLGMGYGTTLTPALLVAGFAPLQIVPCILLSEFITGLAAALMHHHDGNVDLLGDKEARTAALTLSILSAVGAIAAVLLSLQVPGAWRKGIIGAIILLAGLTTLLTAGRRLRYRTSHLIGLGALAAFNKGLSGGGYGPLVTAGQVVSGLSPKKAVAITSLAESLTCLVGLAAYVVLKGDLDWTLALPLTLGAVLSVPMATLTVRRLSESVIRMSVGTVTCVLGLFTLGRLLW